MAGWIDSHVHLDYWRIEDVPGVIRTAQQAGVGKILTVGRSVTSSAFNVWIAHRFDSVVAGVAIHPLWPDPLDNAAYQRLKALTKNKKVVAIGETGIGIGMRPETRDQQREKFARHIRLGREVGLPIVIHNDRGSGADIIEIFEKENGMEVGGVMHSTMVDINSARPLWEMGVYISFGYHPFQRDGFEYLEDVIQQVPDDKLIIETDSAGGLGGATPEKVAEVAKKVAAIRKTTPAHIRQVSVRNINKLFRLDGAPARPTRRTAAKSR
ncbi:MAG: TatD family hydrolase [Chloroflexota bacterium]